MNLILMSYFIMSLCSLIYMKKKIKRVKSASPSTKFIPKLHVLERHPKFPKLYVKTLNTPKTLNIPTFFIITK